MAAETPVSGVARWTGVAKTARAVAVELGRDRVTGLAAEVAFFAILSVFPGMLMVAAAMGFLDQLFGSDLAHAAQSAVVDFLNRILTEEASGAVHAVRGLFERGSIGVFTFSILSAVWALTRGFMAVIRAVRLAYDLPETRSLRKQTFLALALGLGSVLMAVIALGIVVAGRLLVANPNSAELLGIGRGLASVWPWISWPLAFAFLVAGAVGVYQVASGRHGGGWREGVPGALFAATSWMLGSAAFSSYVRVTAGANKVFGLLGGGLILLLWLYVLSFGLLMGGELNGVLKRRRDAAAFS